MHLQSYIQVAVAAFATLSIAHPGEHEERDVQLDFHKRQLQANSQRSLEKCSNKFETSGLRARAQARRRSIVDLHSKRRKVRDTDTILNTSHLSTDSSINENTAESIIFASNSTCVLYPEGETGPYWVKGEHIRSELRENQTGVPIIIEGQFVDVETCEPIEGLYWDLWNCNATGVYSGLVATGNGNTDDTSNLNATFLRGVAQSDADGVVKFSSLFPGHYSGRTTHHHMVVHLNATVLPNNTLSGGTVAHIGQAFWDQDLIYKVEATYPYNTNNITITTNADDRVFATESSTDSDPVFEYVMLGDSLSDGLFGWLTVAVNTSAEYDPNYSFVYTASGGEAESGGDTTVDGDGGSGAPNGTTGSALPSGAAPTGL